MIQIFTFLWFQIKPITRETFGTQAAIVYRKISWNNTCVLMRGRTIEMNLDLFSLHELFLNLVFNFEPNMKTLIVYNIVNSITTTTETTQFCIIHLLQSSPTSIESILMGDTVGISTIDREQKKKQLRATMNYMRCNHFTERWISTMQIYSWCCHPSTKNSLTWPDLLYNTLQWRSNVSRVCLSLSLYLHLLLLFSLLSLVVSFASAIAYKLWPWIFIHGF